MKKVFALFVIASAFTFAACAKKAEHIETADTVAVDTMAAPVEMTADTTAAADTAAATDTAAHAADHAAEGHAPAAH